MIDLNSVVFETNVRANINYVKARIAIEETMKTRATKRAAKMAVVQHLNGTITHPDRKDGLFNTPNHKAVAAFVTFPDHSKAQF